MESLPAYCPYCCGEPVDIDVDESGGAVQHFVQDCPVCCRPWEVELMEDPDGGWTVVLRTSDE